MKRLVAGNWKMNLGPHEGSVLVKRVAEHIEATDNTEVVVCPPFIDLFPLAREIDRAKLRLGAQTMHHVDEGAYTGEISGAMLRGLVDYVIIGHSERRAMGETDKLIAQKVAAAIRNNLKPILCVGESLAERQRGLTTKIVTDQLTANLADVTSEDMTDFVIAYEPIWAIGTGVSATPDDVAPAIRAIRTTIEELYGEPAAGSLRVLYGGSATAEIAGAMLGIDGVDGFLAGGASLNYEKFAALVKATQEFSPQA